MRCFPTAVRLAIPLVLALGLCAAACARTPPLADRSGGPPPTSAAAQGPANAPVSAEPRAGAGGFGECARGWCRIVVDGPSEVPLAATAEVTRLDVGAVDPTEVSLVVTVPGTRMSTSCSGACLSSRVEASGARRARATVGEGARLVVNGLRIEVLSIGTRGAELDVDSR